MHQQGIEIVKMAAGVPKSSADAAQFIILAKECVAKGVEHGDEGQLHFRIGVVDGWVEESGNASILSQYIAAPHVAVDERGRGRFIQPAGEAGSQFFDASQS